MNRIHSGVHDRGGRWGRFLKYRPILECASLQFFLWAASSPKDHNHRPDGSFRNGGRRSRQETISLGGRNWWGGSSPLTTGAISGHFYCYPPVIGYLLSSPQIPPFLASVSRPIYFQRRDLFKCRCWWKSIGWRFSSWSFLALINCCVNNFSIWKIRDIKLT